MPTTAKTTAPARSEAGQNPSVCRAFPSKSSETQEHLISLIFVLFCPVYPLFYIMSIFAGHKFAPAGHFLFLLMRRRELGKVYKKSEKRLPKNDPAEGFGGKKRVKGNRQGSLSRSITRRSGQNCKIKLQIFACSLSKSL